VLGQAASGIGTVLLPVLARIYFPNRLETVKYFGEKPESLGASGVFRQRGNIRGVRHCQRKQRKKSHADKEKTGIKEAGL
jgi:hypothetical protein